MPLRDEPISRVRLRTGRELCVIDISDGGVLVEGSARLLPGTHVDVHVMTRDGRVLVRSRVARCYVSALHADAVRYRGALAFDRHVDTASVGYVVPDAPRGPAEESGGAYPAPPDPPDAPLIERLSA